MNRIIELNDTFYLIFLLFFLFKLNKTFIIIDSIKFENVMEIKTKHLTRNTRARTKTCAKIVCNFKYLNHYKTDCIFKVVYGLYLI